VGVVTLFLKVGYDSHSDKIRFFGISRGKIHPKTPFVYGTVVLSVVRGEESPVHEDLDGVS
jgi:hypothetical protein